MSSFQVKGLKFLCRKYTYTIRALSSYDILPITKVIGLTVIMTWNVKEKQWRLNKGGRLLAAQLRYFNNKINFLFSCEIRSWSLRFRQFDICQVNTAQNNTLVYSIVTNRWAKFGTEIFRHFWDIAIFVLGYFILPHRVCCGVTVKWPLAFMEQVKTDI